MSIPLWFKPVWVVIEPKPEPSVRPLRNPFLHELLRDLGTPWADEFIRDAEDCEAKIAILEELATLLHLQVKDLLKKTARSPMRPEILTRIDDTRRFFVESFHRLGWQKDIPAFIGETLWQCEMLLSDKDLERQNDDSGEIPSAGVIDDRFSVRG